MKRSLTRVFFRVVVIAFIGYVLFTLIALQVSIVQKRREVASLQNEVAQQEIKNEETKKTLDESDQEELIRRFAENQGYAYQGEKIFIDESVN